MSSGVFAHWPNRITGLRFVGSLLLFSILSLDRMQGALPSEALLGLSFWLFLAIAISDFLDGWLARRGNLVTAFGRVADPFVDKIMVVGTMIFLAVMEWSRPWFPAWIVVVVLAREFLVTGIRGYVESQGLAFPADGFGKLKMVLQCIAIGVVLGLHAFAWPDVLRSFLHGAGYVFVWGTLLASLGSGFTYALKTRRLLFTAGGGA